MNLNWNVGTTENSREMVFVLSQGKMPVDPGNFKDLRNHEIVIAIAVPFREIGYTAYDMQDDGKMVCDGKRKTWESLSDIKKHFETRTVAVIKT